MEPSPPNLPAPATLPLAEYSRQEIAGYGGPDKFLSAMMYERTRRREDGSRDPYFDNLRQMERVARFVAEPHKQASIPNAERYANAFYWGEFLAMEISERVMDEDWSRALYKKLSDMQRVFMDFADQEDRKPSLDNSEEVSIHEYGKDANRAVFTANMIIGLLDDAEDRLIIAEPLEDLGFELAADLLDDLEGQRFALLGYRLVMKLFGDYVVQRDFAAKATELGEAIDEFSEAEAIGGLAVKQCLPNYSVWAKS